jgi:DNA-binding HxlR family transcriptional regulator
MKKTMRDCRRSGCPVSFTLDFLGDKWTLLVVRDILFKGMKYYGEFLNSGEGMATNILADRLEKLEQAGIIGWKTDPDHQGKAIYSLTEKGLDLLPMLLEMILWGAKHDPLTEAPKDFVAEIKKDREAVIRKIRKNLSKPAGL